MCFQCASFERRLTTPLLAIDFERRLHVHVTLLKVCVDHRYACDGKLTSDQRLHCQGAERNRIDQAQESLSAASPQICNLRDELPAG